MELQYGHKLNIYMYAEEYCILSENAALSLVAFYNDGSGLLFCNSIEHNSLKDT